MSRFWTRPAPEIVLEAKNVAGGFLLAGDFIHPPLPADQPGGFQLFEVDVERGAGDFGIGRQLVLRGETPEIRVVPVAEIPEHQLGHGAEPALLDRPVGGLVAHSAAVTVTSAAAVPAFIAREPEIDAALDGIRAAREDHFFASPDNVNWGHVTAIADHAELLKRIADALCREGEHSDGA